ncbi:MAG: tetratricopeptide repeat protein [Bacteroidetes bacterium]|nr:tetratricopeptide repeat protein [Bacteroidota bacterium]
MKHILTLLMLPITMTVFAQSPDTSQVIITDEQDSIVYKMGDQVIKFSHKDLSALSVEKGINYASTGDFQSALSEFNAALLYSPDDPDIYYNIGLAYYYLEDLEQSIAHLSRGIELAPGNNKLYSQRGISYSVGGLYESALTDFNKMLEIDPGSSEARANIGATYLLLENTIEACKYLKEAAEMGNEKAISLVGQYCE